MTTDRIKAALTIGLRGKGLDGLTEATDALIREAVERESARWVEALTSDEVREAVADAITYHPGNRLGTPEQRQNASALLALIALKAAADTIREQE